ncbi:MAG: UDP-glucose 4-epimerase GalE [Duodenibacillus sp.]|nr:UDP-glucose 4-epimerase GalE [Duodenibacillus sp.]
MRVLLTGGAGFIGSHTAVELMQAGHQVVLYDNFSNSSPDVLSAIQTVVGIAPTTVEGDVRDTQLLTRTLQDNGIEGVIHLAGLKSVAESRLAPWSYYDNNVTGTLSLLKAMSDSHIAKLIFSSSATVYGQPTRVPLAENQTGGSLTNPYGRSKMFVESILRDIVIADASWSIICLRYFNPVGAHPSGRLGENPNGEATHLFPCVVRAATGRAPSVDVFGTDYDTPDGTAIRDYIHVVDLALGHVHAIECIERFCGFDVINLGTGMGYSVLDVIKTFEKACGHPISVRFSPRRKGDVSACWADTSKARDVLHWSATHDLETMCSTALAFALGSIPGKRE